MRGGSDETVLYELDDRGVIHGNVRDVVFPRNGETTKFGTRNPSCAAETLHCWGIGQDSSPDPSPPGRSEVWACSGKQGL